LFIPGPAEEKVLGALTGIPALGPLRIVAHYLDEEADDNEGDTEETRREDGD
jgi:hypothetical protein